MIISGQRTIGYQDKDSKWTVWQAPKGLKPLMQISAAYHGPEVTEGHEDKAWATFDMSEFTEVIDETKRYYFEDLLTGRRLILYGNALLEKGLTIGLNTETQRQHFIVYKMD